MQQQASVLDTLVYLFDYLVYEKKQRPSIAEMHKELGAAGFNQKDIDRAMTWLLDLNDMQEGQLVHSPTTQAVRQFTEMEAAKISQAGRGCLYELTQLGVLDTRLREIIIQKLMTLEENQITVEEIKWVALMAVYNRDGQEANAVWLEQSLFDDDYGKYCH